MTVGQRFARVVTDLVVRRPVDVRLGDRGLAAEWPDPDALERKLGVLGELLEHRPVVTRTDSLVEPLDVRLEEILAKRLRPSPIPAHRSQTARRC